MEEIVVENLTNFRKVENFMLAFGQNVFDKNIPQFPDEDTVNLRLELIEEEVEELREAIQQKNLVKVADALTDILYVVYGAGHSFGIELDRCFDEVQRSNMSKLGEDGKPIYREDGKVMKGPNYSEPNLSNILYAYYEQLRAKKISENS